MRYYPELLPAIPLYKAGCLRVTHPSAARFVTEATPLARLACVMRAASVYPEPGSNSHLKVFPYFFIS